MKSKSKPKPDDRSDNVEKIQDHIDNTIRNIELAEDMMGDMDDSSKNREDLKEKNERRQDALEGMRKEIRDEAKDRERGNK